MKTILIVLSVLGVTWLAVGALMRLPEKVTPVQAAPGASSALPLVAPLSATQIPSPTVGFEATAAAALVAERQAKETAQAAQITSAQITAQADGLRQEQMRWTAVADDRTHEALVWTATAALTAVPMTATAQVKNWEAAEEERALQAGELTGTAEGPDLLMSMARAEMEHKYGDANNMAQIAAYFGVGMIGLGVLVFSFRRQKIEPKTGDGEEAKVLKIVIQKGTPAYPDVTELEIPCSPDELRAMAWEIGQNESLAIGRWEAVWFRDGMLFSRARLHQVLWFLVEAGLAMKKTDNEHVLLLEGREFFARIRAGELPPPLDGIEPDFVEPTGENTHNYGYHARDSGGGVGKFPKE